MSKVLEDLCNIRQKPSEAVEVYCCLINESLFRCVKLHSEDEKMNLYVDGLLNTIGMVVAIAKAFTFAN